MNYEINFLVLQSRTAQIEKIREDVKKIIKDKGGKVTDELFYKKRKLAYEINHEHYGYFNVLRFELEKLEQIKELKNDLNLAGKSVTRYIIVKANELPALVTVKEMVDEKEKQEDKKLLFKKQASEKESDKKNKLTSRSEKEKKSEIVDHKDTKKKISTAIKKEDIDKEIATSVKKGTKKEQKKEASLNDLDKKLDEILKS